MSSGWRGCPINPFVVLCLRFINTEGLLSKVVSRNFIRPGAATAAYFSELATAALPLIAIQIPQFLKYQRIVPDIFKTFLFYLAAIKFKIAAGLHLARV